MDNIWSIITNLFAIRDVILFAAGALAAFVIIFIFFRWWFRKEWRLFNNLRRPVLVVSAKGAPLGLEVELLRKSKLFNIQEVATDPEKASSIIDKHVAVVVAYREEDHTKVMILVDVLRVNKIPIIIYTSAFIDEIKKAEIDQYSLADFANSPLRLQNLVFNIAAVMPNDKK